MPVDKQEIRIYGNSGGSPAFNVATPTAPVIITSTASETYGSSASTADVSFTPTSGQVAAGRTDFGGTVDASTHQYICLQLNYNGFSFPGPESSVDTLANGGISIVFYDNSGNWSEFHFFGNEYTTSQFDLSSGRWRSFQAAGSVDAGLIYIDRSFTPDSSSGTMDWSNLAGAELVIRVANSGGSATLALGSISNMGLAIITGGSVGTPEGFVSINPVFNLSEPQAAWRQPAVFKGTSGDFQGAKAETFEPRIGWQIGNGTDSTYFRDSGSTLAMYPARDSSLATYPFCVLARGSRTGIINTNVSGGNTFDCQMTGTIFACAADGERDLVFTATGSNAYTITNGEWIRHRLIQLGPGICPGAIFNDFNRVEIDTTTQLTRATARNGKADGLYINTGPHDYSDIDLFYELSNQGIDVTIEPTAAGAFPLTGLSVESGKVLNVFNASTTHAITVTLAAGIGFNRVNLWFDYDNEASGPFTEGETLTFGNGATATLVRLVDNGTTGTMYCDLLTGAVPSDNDTISGATATADINGTVNNSDITIDSSVTVTVRVTVLDSAQTPIQDARVLLLADSGGPLAADTVILEGLTDANGVIETTSFTYTANQPVRGTARKASSAPFYKANFIAGTINSAGLDTSSILILDQ